MVIQHGLNPVFFLAETNICLMHVRMIEKESRSTMK